MRKYGLRSYRLKSIEDALLSLFNESKVGVPELEQITFSVASYPHDKKVSIHGFLHVGDGCLLFHDVAALDVLLDEADENKKKEILFQSFKGVLL